MKKIWIGLVAVILVVSLGYFFLNKQEKKEETIKIGAIVHLTGASASLGEPLKNGLLYAEKVINENGGINGKQVTLIIEDSQTSAKGTVNAFNKLLINKVSAIITTGDIEFRAINDAIGTKDIPIIATACTGGIENRSPHVFRYCYSEESQDKDLCEFAKNTLGFNSMSLVYPNNLYGADILKYTKHFFEDLGGTIISEPYEVNVADQRAVALKVLQNKPNIVCVRGIGNGFESAIRNLYENGFRGQFVGDVTISLPSTVENLKEILENAMFVASELDVNSEDAFIQEYVKGYREMFKTDPNFWDALGFDSFYFLSKAMSYAENNNKSVQNSLWDMGEIKGLLGTHGFAKNGDIEFKTDLFVIKNGKPQLYK